MDVAGGGRVTGRQWRVRRFMPTDERFAFILAVERTEVGLTIEDLAALSGVDAQAIRDAEARSIHLSAGEARALFAVLDVEPLVLPISLARHSE
ncbi:MAG: helix-turn-helix domain-containing protein [Bifidobacteriaceae bacterium]|jgi:ribosome-binding protein aMBF1 (putative translation factor)|nr:helix-turn-helix domain-containing protein [Bifidobacteriaceae bacterium]